MSFTVSFALPILPCAATTGVKAKKRLSTRQMCLKIDGERALFFCQGKYKKAVEFLQEQRLSSDQDTSSNQEVSLCRNFSSCFIYFGVPFCLSSYQRPIFPTWTYFLALRADVFVSSHNVPPQRIPPLLGRRVTCRDKNDRAGDYLFSRALIYLRYWATPNF